MESLLIERVGPVTKSDIPKPLLKWVGGKGQIIDTILARFPKKIINYHEPFLGGGSVLMGMLWLQREGHLTVNGHIYAYDLNPALIGFYQNVKDVPDKLYKAVKKISDVYMACETEGPVNRCPSTLQEAKSSKESYYYWIRQQYNQPKAKTSVISSARFLFLNKTGFRGMYREGPRGFNIPYGHPKNPCILDPEALTQTSSYIQGVTFTHCDFQKVFEGITGSDNMIYLDPPYAPESDTSFVGYTKDGFPMDNHLGLFQRINEQSPDNHLMMSNSDVPLVRENLSEDHYTFEVVSCRRAINSKNPGAKTNEVILTTY
jgi:DNA adenine methylase